MSEAGLRLMPSDPRYERYNEWQTEIHVALNPNVWRGGPEFTDDLDRACFLSERYSQQFQMAREPLKDMAKRSRAA